MYQKSFWKRIFAVMVSAAITVPVASSSFIPVSATINLYDVWFTSEVNAEKSFLPDYVQRAFDEAMEGYNGLPLTPIAYYGTQVVAGYNYALICQERLNNGNISLKEVTIYDPLSGNGEEKAKIYVSDFNLKDYETSYSYPLPQQPPCGSMEIADDMSGAGLPENVKKVYDKFFNMHDGWGCRTLAFLGEKHNNEGTDYAILGETYAIVPDADRFIDVVVLHEDNDGHVYVKSTHSLLGQKGRYATELENYSRISRDRIALGGTFDVEGYAEGGDGNYTYAVLYKKKSDKKWTVKQNYSTNEIITVKPAKATMYDVCIKVKDGTGKIVKKFFEVQVNEKLKNNSTISAATIKRGETVTVNASSIGGTGVPEYAVLYKKVSDSKWTIKQGYKENNKIVVKPYKSTDYNICVKAKDFDGTISKKYFLVTVE